MPRISLSIRFSLTLLVFAFIGALPAAGQTPKKEVGLMVTLEYPGNSPHLKGLSLPEAARKPYSRGGEGAEVLTFSVPVLDMKYSALPLAVIDGEPLVLGEFRQALSPSKDEAGESVHVTDQDPAKLLQRLVDSRVVIREAREIGLDKLPEIRELVDVFGRQTLRDLLLQKRLANVRESEKEVERLYREAIREAKIRAVLFDKQADAKSFSDKLKAGGKFAELAEKVAAEKKGEVKGGAEGEYVRQQEMLPEMAAAISKVKKGGITPVIPVGGRFAVIQLLETRTTENPHLRTEARQRARNFAQNTALLEYNKVLTEKYVKLDRKLFAGLDFTKVLESSLTDKRVLADIRGETPITVADLAKEVKSRYYHGVQQAIEKGTIEEGKVNAMNDLISKRVFLKEALAQGLDRTDAYRQAVDEYENSLVFGTFVQKVVVPEVKIAMDDLRSHYKKNIQSYTYPEMLGIRSLVFSRSVDAQATLEKLKKGTDFHWLEVNTAGQLPKGTPGVLQFGEDLLAVRTLPADLRKTLEGAKAGAVRLHDDGKGHHYVLMVEKVVPARVQPFEEVQSTILKTVYEERVQQALQEWSGKLRKSYPVELFVKGFNRSRL